MENQAFIRRSGCRSSCPRSKKGHESTCGRRIQRFTRPRAAHDPRRRCPAAGHLESADVYTHRDVQCLKVLRYPAMPESGAGERARSCPA